jgi:hypothetical protein
VEEPLLWGLIHILASLTIQNIQVWKLMHLINI